MKSYLANYDTNFISQERYIDWASGCSLVIRRNVYEALNGFDENFFLYCEDEDFCKRANMLGFKVLYTPDITVIHYEGGSAKNKQIKEFSVRQRTISELYFFKKHFQDKFSKILIFYKLISVIGSLFNRRFKIIRNLLKDIKL
ncbi:MAG: galactosyltransferase-related protein [candidate division WOR-3 bacterium]|nr:galactosyltransferase-related protein [candidate division WOR-3 bacterium]